MLTMRHTVCASGQSHYHFILQYYVTLHQLAQPEGALESTAIIRNTAQSEVVERTSSDMHVIVWAKVDLVNCHPNYHKNSWHVQTDRMSHHEPLPLGGPLLHPSVCLYSTLTHNFYSWLHTACTLQLYNHEITLLVMWVPSGGIYMS